MSSPRLRAHHRGRVNLPTCVVRFVAFLSCWLLVSLPLHLLVALAICTLILPPSLLAQQGPENGNETVAVMDLELVGASKAQSAALTNKLREEILRGGKYKLVDRSQMEAVLNEQALQQTGCTTQECAVQVGQILGIRKIITGNVVKLDEKTFQVSATMIDVETAQTDRAASVVYEGGIVGLINEGMPELAARLTGAPGTLPGAVAQAPAAEEEGGISWLWWVLGGLLVLGAAAAAGGGGDGAAGGGDTTTITVTW